MMSTVTPIVTDQPVAPRAGADLRAARERLGWPIDALAQELRIRLVHLEALGEGRLSTLPGHPSALAFRAPLGRRNRLGPKKTHPPFKDGGGRRGPPPETGIPRPGSRTRPA